MTDPNPELDLIKLLVVEGARFEDMISKHQAQLELAGCKPDLIEAYEAISRAIVILAQFLQGS